MNYSIDTGLQAVLDKASYPFREALPNIFFTRSAILDIVAKKTRQTKQTLAKKDLGDEKDMKVFETFYGREVEEPLYIGSAKSYADINSTKTDIFVTDGDEINPENPESSNIWAQFDAVDIGSAMVLTKTEKQRMEQYVKNRTIEGATNLLEMKWNTWLEEKLYQIADNVYNGTGASATPRPQLEGLTKLYDTTYAYGLSAADFANFPVWTPYVWDLQTANTTSVLGYTGASTAYDTRAELIDNTASSGTITPGVPIIIDVLRRAVQTLAAYNRGVKPDLILCRRSLLNMVNDALTAMDSRPTVGEKAKEFIAMGYPDTIEINGVPIVPDDTSIIRKESKTINYACPDGQFQFIYLKDFKFKVNDLDNFTMSGWEPVPGRYGLLQNVLSATCVFYNTRRDRAAVLKLPAAFSSDGY